MVTSFLGRRTPVNGYSWNYTVEETGVKRGYSPIAPLKKLAVGVEDKTEGVLLVIARMAMK